MIKFCKQMTLLFAIFLQNSNEHFHPGGCQYVVVLKRPICGSFPKRGEKRLLIFYHFPTQPPCTPCTPCTPPTPPPPPPPPHVTSPTPPPCAPHVPQPPMYPRHVLPAGNSSTATRAGW